MQSANNLQLANLSQQPAKNAVNDELAVISPLNEVIVEPCVDHAKKPNQPQMAAPTSAKGESCLGTLAYIGGCATLGAVAYSAIGALSGYATGAVGGAILDQFDVPENYKGLSTLAGQQGAVGGAILNTPIGALVGGAIGIGTALLGDGEGAATAGTTPLVSSFLFSAAYNALGNAVFASTNHEHSSQLEGLAATGAGSLTFAAAGAALGVAICCCCCCGLTAGLAASAGRN